MTRRCRECGETKPLADFYAHRYGHRHRCKECVKANSRRLMRRHSRAKRRYINVAKHHPCLGCGVYKGSRRMHFDHRPGMKKAFSIGSATNRAWRALKDEIAKCDIRCAECHGSRHGAAS